MSREIIQPVKDVNFYVEWSSVVDMPTFWGTWQDFLEDAVLEGWIDRFDARMKRVDETSQSALWHTYSWDNDHEIIVQQAGTLRRSQLPAFIETLDDEGQLTEASKALLEPLDWEDD